MQGRKHDAASEGFVCVCVSVLQSRDMRLALTCPRGCERDRNSENMLLVVCAAWTFSGRFVWLLYLFAASL